MSTEHEEKWGGTLAVLPDGAAGCGVVSQEISIPIIKIDAPSQGAFFYLSQAEAYPSSVYVLDLALSGKSDKTLDALLPISEDEHALATNTARNSPGSEPLHAGPPLGTRNAQAENTGLPVVYALFMRGLPGGDDHLIVGQLARTLPMGPSYRPTVTDSGPSCNTEATANHDGLETMTTEILHSTEESVPNFGDETQREPASENTAPNGIGRGDECRAMRALMPQHLLRDLEDDLDQILIDHVRSCPECHSVLMALRIEIDVAAARAEHGRMPQ